MRLESSNPDASIKPKRKLGAQGGMSSDLSSPCQVNRLHYRSTMQHQLTTVSVASDLFVVLTGEILHAAKVHNRAALSHPKPPTIFPLTPPSPLPTPQTAEDSDATVTCLLTQLTC